MALDDLDLEFEDEEEAKKKTEAVHQDVDLEFSLQDNAPTPRPQRPGPSAVSRPGALPRPGAQVKNIEEARTVQNGAKRPAMGSPQANNPATASVSGANALKMRSQEVLESHYDLESEEIVELRERARKAEFDAEVKVQVADFKTELLSELLSDVKLMDHKINQLLVRINAKHPDMKQEVLTIKKLLADFTAKKRK